MVIRINGADADIKPETEKTVGEILSGLESWLTGSGHRMSGLVIDDIPVDSNSMDECFNKEIDTIKVLDIKTSSVSQLLAECLVSLLQDTNTWENTSFSEKVYFMSNWQKSPEACMLSEQVPVLYDLAVKTFSGEGAGSQVLRQLTEEHLRELQDPVGETGKSETAVTEICTRLEELPLDMQTGKDSRAVETIKTFSGILEKIFRIIGILKMEGFPVAKININNTPVAAYIAEFNTALRELLCAYEQYDTVLVGDLAEYEMAPRLRDLYAAVWDTIRGDINEQHTH